MLKSKGCKLIHSINEKVFDTALLDSGNHRRVNFVLAAYVFVENGMNLSLFCTLSLTLCNSVPKYVILFKATVYVNQIKSKSGS